MSDAFSLDQFSTFVVVADEGRFAAAARRMRRAQSAITYAIQKLEEQSGALLFDRSAYRPQLTEAGRSLLPHARRVLADVSRYRAQSRAIGSGIEAEIRLLIPEALPAAALVPCLAMMRMVYPSVRMRIETETPSVALRRIAAGSADLAILLDAIDLPPWLHRSPCSRIDLVVVVSPEHPLAVACQPVKPEVLADHLQIVVAAPLGEDLAPDRGVVASERWHVTDYAFKRELLLAGVGWGSMPAHLVSDDVSAGRLITLVPATWDGATRLPVLGLVVGKHADRPPGPAAQALFEAIATERTQDDG